MNEALELFLCLCIYLGMGIFFAVVIGIDRAG